MQKQIIEMFEQTTATAMESARKIGELNQRTFDKMFQQQADLAAFFMDASARGMELMTKAKGYQDLMAGQTALLRECGERGITAGHVRDFERWINQRYAKQLGKRPLTVYIVPTTRDELIQDVHDGIYGRTIYVADPDGTKVELYEPSR